MIKNPQANSEYGKFIVAYKDTSGELQHHIICTSYSQAGVCRAFQGYSNITLATAGGYGYDKTSQALSMAIEKLTGKTIGGYGTGVNSVIKMAGDCGVKVYDHYDLYSLAIDNAKTVFNA